MDIIIINIVKIVPKACSNTKLWNTIKIMSTIDDVE